jgi:hypothetical protein
LILHGHIIRIIHNILLSPHDRNHPMHVIKLLLGRVQLIGVIAPSQMKNTSLDLEFFPFEVHGEQEFFRVLLKY